jgi:hypothetical protein
MATAAPLVREMKSRLFIILKLDQERFPTSGEIT